MPSSISDLDGLGPSFAVKLKKAGIRTTEKLLESAKSLRGRQMLAEETEIDEKQLLRVAGRSAHGDSAAMAPTMQAHCSILIVRIVPRRSAHKVPGRSLTLRP